MDITESRATTVRNEDIPPRPRLRFFLDEGSGKTLLMERFGIRDGVTIFLRPHVEG